MHLKRCDSIRILPPNGVLNKLSTSNTRWRRRKAQEVLTPVPGATRLRVVGAARPLRMGYIRFRWTAVIPPVTVLSLRRNWFFAWGSVDVTEMAKLRDAGAAKLVTSGTQSNFKMGTGLVVS
jgi:hypothetical protein